MPYWAVARLAPYRETLALSCLALAGYPTYLPRLRERRVVQGRKVEVRPPLFPGYCFLEITLQWSAARWCPGVMSLITNGAGPARVPDHIIDEIRAREVRGLVELPKPEKFKSGTHVRVLRGALEGRLGLVAGMRPRERVEILLTLLGAARSVVLPKLDIEEAVL